MAKYLKINSFENIAPSDLTGYKYRLNVEIGSYKNTFIPKKSYSAQIQISDILVVMWKVDITKLEFVLGSICLSQILELAKNNDLESLKPIILDTFNSGEKPPNDVYGFSIGSIYAFSEKKNVKKSKSLQSEISILSNNISDIRDHINTYTKKILGKKILLINQERALFDMYKSANSNTEFVNRISSLSGLIISIDKKTIVAFLDNSNTDDSGEIIILEKLLTLLSNKEIANRICIVFKKINDLRKGYPIHGDNIDHVLPAHDFFGLTYPIVNYKDAWEKILNSYLESMIMIREILIDYYNNKYKKN